MLIAMWPPLRSMRGVVMMLMSLWANVLLWVLHQLLVAPRSTFDALSSLLLCV